MASNNNRTESRGVNTSAGAPTFPTPLNAQDVRTGTQGPSSARDVGAAGGEADRLLAGRGMGSGGSVAPAPGREGTGLNRK